MSPTRRAELTSAEPVGKAPAEQSLQELKAELLQKRGILRARKREQVWKRTFDELGVVIDTLQQYGIGTGPRRGHHDDPLGLIQILRRSKQKGSLTLELSVSFMAALLGETKGGGVQRFFARMLALGYLDRTTLGHRHGTKKKGSTYRINLNRIIRQLERENGERAKARQVGPTTATVAVPLSLPYPDPTAGDEERMGQAKLLPFPILPTVMVPTLTEESNSPKLERVVPSDVEVQSLRQEALLVPTLVSSQPRTIRRLISTRYSIRHPCFANHPSAALFYQRLSAREWTRPLNRNEKRAGQILFSLKLVNRQWRKQGRKKIYEFMKRSAHLPEVRV